MVIFKERNQQKTFSLEKYLPSTSSSRLVFCLFIILNFICPCPVIITLNLLVGARTTIATVQVTDLR